MQTFKKESFLLSNAIIILKKNVYAQSKSDEGKRQGERWAPSVPHTKILN